MDYTSIGHEGKEKVWLWHFTDALICVQKLPSHLHEHIEDVKASGRVDKKRGSVVFTPKLPKELLKRVCNSLVEKFPGVKFYIISTNPGEKTQTLQEFYKKTF